MFRHGVGWQAENQVPSREGGQPHRHPLHSPNAHVHHQYAARQQQRRTQHNVGGEDIHAQHHGNASVVERFHRWESKVLASTDTYASCALLVIIVLGLPTMFERFEITSGPRCALILISMLVAHLYVVKFHQGFYKNHRELMLSLMRILFTVGSMVAWASSPNRQELSDQVLICSRLLYGVFTTLGWQLNTQLSLVVQLFLLIVMRITMAISRSTQYPKMRCSPLAICTPAMNVISSSSSGFTSGGDAAAASAPSQAAVHEDFSYALQGFLFDTVVVVVIPALALRIKRKHSELLFQVEFGSYGRPPAGFRRPSGWGRRAAVDNPRPSTAMGAAAAATATATATATTRTAAAATTMADEAARRDFLQRAPPFAGRFWSWYRRKLPLMSFPDAELERRFDHWHRNQMVNLDLVKMGVSLLSVLAWVRKFRRIGADVEATRYLSVVFFAVNLAHGWFMTSSRATYVKHRTALLWVLRLVMLCFTAAFHLLLVTNNVSLAVNFYQKHPDLRPSAYNWSKVSALPLRFINTITLLDTPEGGPGADAGSGGISSSSNSWAMSQTPFCTAAPELAPELGRLPLEMFVMYAVLQTLGTHLLMHTTLFVLTAFVVFGGILRMSFFTRGFRFPTDCQPIKSFFIKDNVVWSVYAGNWILVIYALLAIGVSWFLERWCRNVFTSTSAAESQERVYDAFPFMRMAGTPGEIIDTYQARLQYQDYRRRRAEAAAVVAEVVTEPEAVAAAGAAGVATREGAGGGFPGTGRRILTAGGGGGGVWDEASADVGRA